MYSLLDSRTGRPDSLAFPRASRKDDIIKKLETEGTVPKKGVMGDMLRKDSFETSWPILPVEFSIIP